MNRLAAFFLIALLASPVTAQEIHITPLREDYLQDDVGLLDREQRKEIIGLLEEQGQKTLGRIYLDILNSLPPGLTIEQYARKRLNERPRMPLEKADKIMLVVVLQNKAVRIETSRDVWTILSDAYCHHVNREIMIPKFKRGAYFAGIVAGIHALIKKLEAR
jgi:uncharacterized protein